MRRGPILIFVVILILGLGLGLLYFFYTQFLTPTAQPTQAALSKVYYASQNIPQGTVITDKMLSTFSIPPENVAVVMFEVGEEGALIGQTARITLEQGMVITSSMVGPDVQISGPNWATKIPLGMVAATIPTNRLSLLGYGVDNGAHVNVNACMLFVDVDPAFQSELPNYTSVMRDVFFPPEEQPIISLDSQTSEFASRQGRTEIDPTFQKPVHVVPSEPQRPRLVCQMVLQDVVVLQLGNFGGQAAATTTTTDPTAATPAPAAQPASAPDIVTLMVNPQDSISLNYFVFSGAMLTMSLRNPNDTSRFAAESATLTSMLTQYNISLPSKLPYALDPVIQLLPPAIGTAAPPQQ